MIKLKKITGVEFSQGYVIPNYKRVENFIAKNNITRNNLIDIKELNDGYLLIYETSD